MRRTLLFVGISSAILGVGFGALTDSAKDGDAGDALRAASTVSRADPLAERPGTRRELGRFELRGGRSARLWTADAVAGTSCLLEDDSSSASSMCLEGGLFKHHRVAFFVRSEGGPDRFSELHLSGVVAPEVARATVRKSDGTVADLDLGAAGAFVYESTTAELEIDALPAALSLYRRNGTLIETIGIPGHR